jgi:hypothetical protein
MHTKNILSAIASLLFILPANAQAPPNQAPSPTKPEPTTTPKINQKIHLLSKFLSDREPLKAYNASSSLGQLIRKLKDRFSSSFRLTTYPA